MSLPQIPPGGGSEVKPPHYRNQKTPPGGKWEAYIAGPAHWFWCHAKGLTKPCLEKMTEGQLTCPGCEALYPLEEKGYLPLYRAENGLPGFVIVSAFSREQVDKLKLHQPVMVMKDRLKSDPITVVPALRAMPKFHSTLAYKNRPADLSETLLKVWGYPELVEWYNATHNAGKPPVKVRSRPMKSDGKPFGPMTKAAAAKHDAPQGTGQAFDDVAERLRKRAANLPASPNGKH